MQNVSKSGIPNKEDSDFIKLYMFEKERNRLKSEEIRIMLRLEFVQGRLKEIQQYNDAKAGQMHSRDTDTTKPKKKEVIKPEFKTMSIDY